MIKRYIPMLALAGAICGLALAATSAVAETWHCTKPAKREECRYKLQGKGQQRLTLPNGTSIQCRKLRQEGQFKGKNLDLQSVPKYEECSTIIAAVKHKAKVELKECEIRLTINKGEKGPKQQGTVTIKKTTTPCQITILVEGTTCEIRIKEQGPLTGFRAEQVSVRKEEREVQIQFKVKGIQAEVTEGCGQGKGVKKVRSENTGRARITGLRIR